MIDRKVADPEWMEQYMAFEDELEAARRNAEARGREQGREQGQLDNLRNLMGSTGWDADKAMAALGVPEADRARVASLL